MARRMRTNRDALRRKGRRCVGSKRPGQTGQSILEYLVIVTVVVAAILGMISTVETGVNDFYSATSNKVVEVAGQVGNFTPP